MSSPLSSPCRCGLPSCGEPSEATKRSAQCSTQLFGLDGGCKLGQPEVVPLRDVFSAIETMQMIESMPSCGEQRERGRGAAAVAR